MSKAGNLKIWAGGLIFLLISLSFCCTASASIVTIESIVGQVSVSEYQSFHSAVENCGLGLYEPSFNQGYRNRDGWAGGGSLGNQEAALYLYDTFSGMGLDVSCQGTYNNVVGELTGTVTPEKIYIIGGHYDTYGSGERPGGDDNASGAAGVLEAARVLSQYSFESTIRFISFNAEEDGLLGSSDYVNNQVLANDEDIAGMINFDMIIRPGWDNYPAEPEDLDITTRNTALCLNWANIFINAAQMYVPSLSIDTSSPDTSFWGASDHEPFIAADLPAFMAIENTPYEIWNGSNAYYHQSGDASDGLANNPFNPSGIVYNYDFASDVVRTAVATLAQEAAYIPEPGALSLLALGALALRRKRR